MTQPPTMRKPGEGRTIAEVLTLGVPDEAGNVVLLRPDTDVPLGGRLH